MAWVIVNLMHWALEVPPLFRPIVFLTPLEPSQPASSTMATQVGFVAFAMLAASPMWSLLPCVTNIRSTLSTFLGQAGLCCVQGSIRMILPCGEMILKVACPNHVICTPLSCMSNSSLKCVHNVKCSGTSCGCQMSLAHPMCSVDVSPFYIIEKITATTYIPHANGMALL